MSESAPFQRAYERLLSRAPGPVFPRARSLYLNKYSLEEEADTPFRTFLIEEELQEAAGGAVRSRGVAFAVVHCQAPQVEVAVYGRYLERRWMLQPADLTPMESPWFRNGGAWARFGAAAVYERMAPTTLVSQPADPGVSADAPDPSP